MRAGNGVDGGKGEIQAERLAISGAVASAGVELTRSPVPLRQEVSGEVSFASLPYIHPSVCSFIYPIKIKGNEEKQPSEDGPHSKGDCPKIIMYKFGMSRSGG